MARPPLWQRRVTTPAHGEDDARARARVRAADAPPCAAGYGGGTAVARPRSANAAAMRFLIQHASSSCCPAPAPAPGPPRCRGRGCGCGRPPACRVRRVASRTSTSPACALQAARQGKARQRNASQGEARVAMGNARQARDREHSQGKGEKLASQRRLAGRPRSGRARVPDMAARANNEQCMRATPEATAVAGALTQRSPLGHAREHQVQPHAAAEGRGDQGRQQIRGMRRPTRAATTRRNHDPRAGHERAL